LKRSVTAAGSTVIALSPLSSTRQDRGRDGTDQLPSR